jgi:hypothetical protein
MSLNGLALRSTPMVSRIAPMIRLVLILSCLCVFGQSGPVSMQPSEAYKDARPRLLRRGPSPMI